MERETTFKYWLAVARHTDYKIGKCHRPAFVGEHQVPENLNQLSIGQLIDLSQLGDKEESLYQIVTTVLGMTHEEVEQARAVDVVKMIGWVTSEVERINKLFESTDTAKPTQQEKEAGIDNLRFGLFGMLDWYAVRMGISDHDQVLQTPWLRIYKCMDMDNKRKQYERNLQKVQAEELKRKSR